MCRIIKEDIGSLIVEIGYCFENRFNDDNLNNFLTYWRFLDEKEYELIERLKISKKEILYSKYYWAGRYIREYSKIFDIDVGLEQQQHKIIEEIFNEFDYVNWDFISNIDDSII